MCQRIDLYSCSGCVYVLDNNVTFDGYAMMEDCQSNCKGNRSTYPLCTAQNMVSLLYYNQPLNVFVTCGASSVTTIFCCGGLLAVEGTFLVSFTAWFGLNVCAAISDGRFDIPQLTNVINV